MLKIKKLHPNAKLPTRTYSSAGYDLYACEDVSLPPGKVTPVKLGIATEFPPKMAALIWDRSSMGKNGLHVFGGVIDEDYRGEWAVLLFNSTKAKYEIAAGDRVAQFILQEVQHFQVREMELLPTERGEGAFGSTGT